MWRSIVLAALLTAGCGDDKPTESKPVAPNPILEKKQPPPKRKSGPGMSRVPAPAASAFPHTSC
jgi:hypothetical protein